MKVVQIWYKRKARPAKPPLFLRLCEATKSSTQATFETDEDRKVLWVTIFSRIIIRVWIVRGPTRIIIKIKLRATCCKMKQVMKQVLKQADYGSGE